MVRMFKFQCPKCGDIHISRNWDGLALRLAVYGCLRTRCKCLLPSNQLSAQITTRDRCKRCRDRVGCLSREPEFHIVDWIKEFDVYVLKFTTSVSVDVSFLKNGLTLNNMLPPGVIRGAMTSESHLFFEDWISLCEWGDATVAHLKSLGFRAKRRIRRKPPKDGDIDYHLSVD